MKGIKPVMNNIWDQDFFGLGHRFWKDPDNRKRYEEVVHYHSCSIFLRGRARERLLSEK